jgi:hypothetical protein
VTVDLPAEIADVDVDDFRSRIEAEPPHIVEQARAAHHRPGVLHQIGKEVEFLGRQRDFAIPTPHPFGAHVEDEVSDVEHRVRGGL